MDTKINFRIVNGKWTNDDVDLLPTLKLRRGSKDNHGFHLSVSVTSIALCWLKWGIMMSFGRVRKGLPHPLMTKMDFENVLNYYLPNRWEMSTELGVGVAELNIKLNPNILQHRKVEKLKEYIDNHKSINVFVNYN
jgi:hypothetical protein